MSKAFFKIEVLHCDGGEIGKGEVVILESQGSVGREFQEVLIGSKKTQGKRMLCTFNEQSRLVWLSGTFMTDHGTDIV